MKKLLLFMTLGLFLSCSNVQNPDYDRNLELTKQWFDNFGNEDLDFTMSFFADEIEYQSAFYDGPLMNKDETREYFKDGMMLWKTYLTKHKTIFLVLIQIPAY